MSMPSSALDDIARLRADPVAFVTEVLRDPETGAPFVLYPAEETFLRRGLTLTPDGTLPYPELLFSGPKKSGKTALAAMATLYVVVVLGGPYAEGYCVANDLEQAQGRVFTACARMVEASPLLHSSARILDRRIEFSTGSTITAIASEAAGAAGANPTISVFDELWGYTSERSFRLWDEMVPPPTRRVATRLTVTYAGYEGESTLLEGLYKRATAVAPAAPDLYEAPGLLAYWTHDPQAPWQTPAWLEQMRHQLRPNAYLRMIENRFVSSETSFVDMADWDACTDPALTPTLSDPDLPVYLGVDASTKRDHTAVVVVTYDTQRVRLVAHRIFKPSPADPLDFERTVEEEVLALRSRFRVREVRYDPYQMAASAQRLQSRNVRMVEYPQTSERLERMGTNLYDLVTGHNLAVYPNPELRLAVSRAVARETARGWRIAKERQTDKIDVVVALAMAALAAVEGGVRDERRELACSVSPGGTTKASYWSTGAGIKLLGTGGAAAAEGFKSFRDYR